MQEDPLPAQLLAVHLPQHLVLLLNLMILFDFSALRYFLIPNGFTVSLAVRQAPPPAPASSGGGSMLGGLGATIAQGMITPA